MLSILFVLLFLFLMAENHLVSADTNQTKAICYTGSNLYQRTTQNCNDKDPSYKGTWYCAKMEICEPHINDKRICAVTRGCATEKECADSTSSAGYYKETTVKSGGTNIAGMEITATCCQAHDFPDDDTIALDYSDICNSATSNGNISIMVLLTFIISSALMYFM